MSTFDDPEFRELDPQDVREYWRDEVRQFTPWLDKAIRSEEQSHPTYYLAVDGDTHSDKKK